MELESSSPYPQVQMQLTVIINKLPQAQLCKLVNCTANGLHTIYKINFMCIPQGMSSVISTTRF
jgi:hypothetical protein